MRIGVFECYVTFFSYNMQVNGFIFSLDISKTCVENRSTKNILICLLGYITCKGCIKSKHHYQKVCKRKRLKSYFLCHCVHDDLSDKHNYCYGSGSFVVNGVLPLEAILLSPFMCL